MNLFRKKKDTWDDQISDLFFQNVSPDPSHNPPDNHDLPKKKKTILISVAATLLIIISVAVLADKFEKKKNTNDGAPDSFIFTNDSVFAGAINFDTPITEYLGTKNILYTMSAGYASVSGNITLENLKNAGNTISGMSLEFDLKHNAPNKVVSLNSSLMYRGEEALAIEAYLNTEALSFKVPKKSNKLYCVSFNRLKDNIQSEQSENLTNDFKINFIQNLLSTSGISKFCGDWTQIYGGSDIITLYLNAIKETYPKDYETILDNIIVEDAEPDSYQNPGKTYTITETGVETLVKCILTVTFENAELYNRFYPVLYYMIKNDLIHIPDSKTTSVENDTAVVEMNEHNSNGKSQSSDNNNDNTSDLSTAIDDLLYDIQSTALAFATVYSDSMSFTVWYNEHGMLVGLKGENDIHINNDVVSINVISDSKNESNPIDNSNTNLLIAYGNDSFEVQFSRRTERSDILESVNYISFNMNNKNKIEMHSTESLDTSDNEYEFDLDITSNEDSNTNISLMCVGNFSNIVKDNSFDFHIENMYINEGFSNLITVNGDLSVGTKKPDISKLSGEKSELTEMSAEELAALLGFSTK